MRYSVGRPAPSSSDCVLRSDISCSSRLGPPARNWSFCSNSHGVLSEHTGTPPNQVRFDVVRLRNGWRDSRCQTERPPLGSAPGRNDGRKLRRIAQGLCRVRIHKVFDVIRDPIRSIDLDNQQKTQEAGIEYDMRYRVPGPAGSQANEGSARTLIASEA